MRSNEAAQRVAIIGMSYRLPGCAGGSLWPTLIEARDAVTTVAADRWALDSMHHPRRSEPGTSYTFRAGSIGDIAGFDAGFFGISPREAAQMDPQQRILLELAWESLENAAVRPSTLRGSDCAVYVGMSSVDYSYRLAYDLAGIDSSTATGGTASIAANRISYFLDLRGPSMVIDTACSSSLVAFHQACRAVSSGEASHALVGGISLHIHPYGFVAFSKAQMLSRKGACRVFDAGGDGYVRSEGGGVFVLKPLEAAVRDGNPILAVVAATAVNTGGRSQALTVPNAEAQADLLAEAYRSANIHPAEIDYVEAHGTGTVVGDPIEARALGLALGRARPRSSPLAIGSVKSNLGHLEAASGVAGLAKAILCMRHRTIAPTIHLDDPNPAIAFDEWNLKPVREPVALHPSRKLVVGVNSFGFGGANAHVVLESAPTAPSAVGEASGPTAVVISGHDEAALREAARAHAALLQPPNEASLHDVAYTSIHARDWHAHRAIAAGEDAAGVAAALAAFARGDKARTVASGKCLGTVAGPAFIYSGNGSVWPGMGSRMMAQPTFARAVEEIEAHLVAEGGAPIAGEMRAGVTAQRLAATEVAQPMLLALQVGLTELLRSRGVAPTDVAGHSVGEVTAAWACGALTLREAAQVVFHRSRLQARTRGLGAMLAIGLPHSEAAAFIASLGLDTQLEIACFNSPRHVTVAGPLEPLVLLEHALAQRRAFHRRLDLEYPFHSVAMASLQEDLLTSLRGLRPGAAAVPFHSTVTGDSIPGTLLNAHYWWQNARDPVRFEAAIRTIARSRANVLVEIGPQPILRNYMNDCLRAESVEGRVLASMERGREDAAALEECVHQLAICGCGIDLAKAFPAAGRIVSLPTYPWQRERHWREATPEGYDLVDRPREHVLLGYRLKESAFQWENHLDTATLPAVRDHVVGGAVVLPGSAFVEMALAASRLAHGGDAHEVESLDIRSPMVLDETSSRTVRFAYEPTDGRFTIRSRARLSTDAWQLHATGRLCGAPLVTTPAERRMLPARRPDLTGAEHYELARRLGLAYGPAFQAVARTWIEEPSESAVARLVLPDAARGDANAYAIHPSSLDGAFQVMVDILRDEIPRDGGVAFLPVQVERVRLYGGGAIHACRARIVARSARSLVADFEMLGVHGERIADLRRVRFRGVALKTPASMRLRRLEHRCVAKPLGPDRAIAPPATLAFLAGSFTGRLHELGSASIRARYYTEVEPLCDVLCAGFAERALRQLAPAAPIVPAALAAAIPAHNEPLLRRLISILEEEQLLEPGEGGWRWSVVNELPDAHESWITLIRDYPDEAGLLVPLGLEGMRLADTLQRADDPAEPRAASFAQADVWHAHCGRALAEMARAWVAHAPGERPLRILEVSDAPNGIAARVLGAIEPGRCDYQVGSGSEALLAELQPLCESNPHFDAFSLEAGAEARGPYDVIVVADGLSPWTEPPRLDRLAGLLAQAGVLAILAEHPSRCADLLHGARAGWWMRDAAGAFRSRLRTPGDWEQALRGLGFDSIEIVPETPGAVTGCFAVLAQSDRRVIATAASHDSRAWLLLHDNAPHGAALAAGVRALLRERGDEAHVASTAEGPLQSHFDAARQNCGALAGVICISGFEAPEASCDMAELARRCDGLTRVLDACRGEQGAPRAWIVTAGASRGMVADAPGATSAASIDNAALWGFARSLANEYPDLDLRRVDCAGLDNLETIAARLVDEVAADSGEDEVVLTRDGRHAVRLVDAALHERPAACARLDFAMPGSLKNLEWRGFERRAPRGNEVEIEVRAAGLNFRDVMYSMGLLSDEAVETGFAGPTLGMELTGVVTAAGPQAHGFTIGDEVIAFAPASFATHVLTQAGAVVHKPAAWTFEASATLPIACFTALYSLRHLARLREGESILIHGAAGGVGLAAIQLARALGARVFATAGTPDKREVVRMLGADHVLDSRSLAFADEVMELTAGQGVDVVLNSLSGEALARSLKVLRPFGRFLELGKRDFYENTAIGLRPFRNNISYFGIDADQLLRERPELAREVFSEMMELVAQGTIGPLPYRAFPASQAVEAFRHMQQSRHIGKIVLSLAEGVHAPGRAPPGAIEMEADATYLVTGGLSGFGLRIAQWLAARGARNLMLVSRSGEESLAAKAAVADIEALGGRVHSAACDVTDAASLGRVLERIRTTMPPLRGVVHAAAVIDDGLAHNLTPARIEAVLAPKVLGARNLDSLTRQLPLDFFVLCSSATTLFGNPGQSSYVAANSCLEALARSRRAAGLPATCIAWGAIGDVGYLARNEIVKESLESHMGGQALHSDAALEALGSALASGQSGHAVLEFSWRNLKRFLPTAGSARFRQMGSRGEDAASDSDALQELRQLAQTMGAAELAALVADTLRRELSEILRMPADKLDPRQPLQEMGLDSLMGTELLIAIEARFGLNLQVMALAEGPCIDSLAERIVRDLKSGEPADGAADAQPLRDTVEHVATRYAAELDPERIEELARDLGAGTQGRG